MTAERFSLSPMEQSFVQRVCRRAICLEHGKVIFDGDVDDAFAAYAESDKSAIRG